MEGREEESGDGSEAEAHPPHLQRAHLGQGTRTNIYDGVLSVCGTAGPDDEAEYFSTEQNNNSREIHVVLKVLDPVHRDIALVSPHPPPGLGRGRWRWVGAGGPQSHCLAAWGDRMLSWR